jgi:Dyp-type peroxidase family
MPVNLNAPLRWKSANADELKMLKDLQGNILDGHGRRSTRHLFIRFGADAAAARTFVRKLAPLIKSAHVQLTEAEAFRATGVSGKPFIGLLISAEGYKALGVTAKAPQPGDGGAFSQGMLARAGQLSDPPANRLEAPYRSKLHAMILIGADPDSPTSFDSAAAEQVETQILNLMGSAGHIVHREFGRAIFRNNGTGLDGKAKLEGIEHFGYVDGRSQPLLLEELIERERDETDGISVWSPVFPLSQVLVPDPGAPPATGATAFGSYFVFRKLEQDVDAFKKAEAKLGTLGNPKLGELAGAMMVGRFEDGTPVVLQKEEGADAPVPNNFDYAGDVDGLRCPIHAHIRKTNPRGDVPRQFPGAPADADRKPIMARRGMTFGKRNRVLDPSDTPTKGVGLMFMSFQSNLADQFEFTQQSWADNVNFLRPGTGRDPIIGQRGTNPSVKLQVRHKWGAPGATVTAETFEGFVTHKGGDYFFAPAISTIKAI